jgi:hypothetical protein
MLELLHTDHVGIVRSKSTARSYIWWPKLDASIERMVKRCESCQYAKDQPAAAPLFPWPSAQAP